MDGITKEGLSKALEELCGQLSEKDKAEILFNFWILHKKYGDAVANEVVMSVNAATEIVSSFDDDGTRRKYKQNRRLHFLTNTRFWNETAQAMKEGKKMALTGKVFRQALGPQMRGLIKSQDAWSDIYRFLTKKGITQESVYDSPWDPVNIYDPRDITDEALLFQHGYITKVAKNLPIVAYVLSHTKEAQEALLLHEINQ